MILTLTTTTALSCLLNKDGQLNLGWNLVQSMKEHMQGGVPSVVERNTTVKSGEKDGEKSTNQPGLFFPAGLAGMSEE